MRCGVTEEEEQTVARYLGGMWREIHDVVSLQPYWGYNDVYKLAIQVEKQMRARYRRTSVDDSEQNKMGTTRATTRPEFGKQVESQRVPMQDARNKESGKGKMDAASSEIGPRAKFPPCITCKRTNHPAEDCWYKGKPQFQRTFCNKWGHKEQYCRAKQSQQIQQPMQQANYTDDHVSDDHLFMMSQAYMTTSTETWYVDSGCTSHMARDEGMFTTLGRNATTTVKLRNGDTLKATGRGKVLIQNKSGPKIINDVLYIYTYLI
ncbi:hypothetical protein LWI29_015950 [Acer saccharum]|uniref:Retrovirus-related Pol polyprotein from transposon TNT 1-94-like beta-barrel domain-containing protein n=1 Tax=Acer saccharum TaxID=4024 RepID=A0AA39RR18_ACESA|nr:hypothetical protein LWI29_015950 [Acer saccharum]